MLESYKEVYSAQIDHCHHGENSASARTDFLNQRMMKMKEKKKPNSSKLVCASLTEEMGDKGSDTVRLSRSSVPQSVAKH